MIFAKVLMIASLEFFIFTYQDNYFQLISSPRLKQSMLHFGAYQHDNLGSVAIDFYSHANKFVPESVRTCDTQRNLSAKLIEFNQQRDTVVDSWHFYLKYLHYFCLFPFDRDCRVMIA